MTSASIDYSAWVSRSDAFRIACVQNYGSSGTLFVQSLLDFHPETLALPGLTARDFFEVWRGGAAAVQAPPLARVTSALAPLFDPQHAQWRDWGMDRLGEDRRSACTVDREAFMAHFAALLSAGAGASRRRVLCAIYLAYAFAWGRTPAARALIVFPIHGGSAATAADIEADFPGALYLHMVRHPASNFVSLRRHIESQGHAEYVPTLERAMAQVLSDLQWIDSKPAHGDRPYDPAIGARARAFRLEALHEAPRATLVRIAEFLGIAWDESLMRSTVSGLTWWNRSESPTVSGFDPAIPTRGVREGTHRAERLAIRLAALPKLTAWGYADAARWRSVPGWAVRVAFFAASLVPLAVERRPPPETMIFAAAGAFARFVPADVRAWIGRRWQVAAAFAGRGNAAAENAAQVGGSSLLYVYYGRSDGTGLEGAVLTLGPQAPRPATGAAAFVVLEDALDRPGAGALLRRAAVLGLATAIARWRRYVALRRALWRGYADARIPAAAPVLGDGVEVRR